jgi:hypothetical protein
MHHRRPTPRLRTGRKFTPAPPRRRTGRRCRKKNFDRSSRRRSNASAIRRSHRPNHPAFKSPPAHHGGEEEESPLDEIIRHFNERFFSAWDATPEEQRVKLINIMEHVQASAAYKAQVVDNPDEQNRRIALESLISQAVNKERKKDLDLYKVYAGDPDFKKAFEESIIRILALHEKSRPA